MWSFFSYTFNLRFLVRLIVHRRSLFHRRRSRDSSHAALVPSLLSEYVTWTEYGLVDCSTPLILTEDLETLWQEALRGASTGSDWWTVVFGNLSTEGGKIATSGRRPTQSPPWDNATYLHVGRLLQKFQFCIVDSTAMCYIIGNWPRDISNVSFSKAATRDARKEDCKTNSLMS